MAAGQSEAAIRASLLQNGWTVQAVDDVFAQYYGAAITPSQQVSSYQTQTSPLITQPAIKRSFSPKLAIIAGVIGLIIIVGIVFLLSHGSKPASKDTDKLAQPALQENAADTARQNDAIMLASAISNYLAGHNGTLPQQTGSSGSPDTLNICGPSCTPATESSASLSHYKNTPQAVSFHAYANDLKVADTETVYIVPNAVCSGDSLGAPVQGTAAILYELEKGEKHKCLSL